jgi:hypothetical protein
MTSPPATKQHYVDEYLKDGSWYLAERSDSTSDSEAWSPTPIPEYQHTTYPDFTRPSSVVGQSSSSALQPSNGDRNESAATNLSDISTEKTWEPPPEHTIDCEF